MPTSVSAQQSVYLLAVVEIGRPTRSTPTARGRRPRAAREPVVPPPLCFKRGAAADRCAVHTRRGAKPSLMDWNPVAVELHRDAERRAPRGSRASSRRARRAPRRCPGVAPANPNAHGNARVAAHTQMTGRRCRTATGFRSPPSAPAKHDVQLLAVVEISRPKCRRRRPPKWRPDSASINRSQGAVPTLLEIEQG